MFQNDEESDRSPTIAIWLGLTTAAVVVIALVSAVVTGGLGGASRHASDADASAHSPGQAAGHSSMDPDELLDIPLSGSLLSKVYFGLGSAVLTGEAAREVANVATDLEHRNGRVMLAGFHDPSGNAAFNAALAKNRAIAVREALKAAGVPASRIVLRKPEKTTTGGADSDERRVEMRLID